MLPLVSNLVREGVIMSNELSPITKVIMKTLVVVCTVAKINTLIFFVVHLFGMILQPSISRFIVMALIAISHVLLHFVKNDIETELYPCSEKKTIKQLEQKKTAREKNV